MRSLISQRRISTRVQTIAFQPVSFTGRDEDISDELRIKQRYTLAGMTQDLKDQLRGQLEPLRDWYPLSSYSAFTSVMDMLARRRRTLGLVVMQLPSELRHLLADGGQPSDRRV